MKKGQKDLHTLGINKRTALAKPQKKKNQTVLGKR